MQRPTGRSQAGSGSTSTKELSVIVPTYNETENIKPLCERLFAAVKNASLTTELLFVDDESKGSAETEKIVQELSKSGYNVRIHCRKKSEGRGLSSAVLLGFQKAKYEVILCMDADLQHEPESVPDVAGPVLRSEAEFTVGSRHVDGGGLGFEWSVVRQVISQGATLLAFPIAASTDPMSGFFCTRKEVLNRGQSRLNPIGFKIGLEIMVRCRCRPIQDVAITFQERAAGESKLSASQYRLYLQQLGALYWDRFPLLLVLAFVILLLVVVSVLRVVM
mmetsp:Transcript_47007/g.105438  ORF Transcript_47007/g.105438 Transcript_47007/m.105438 type:complete len:277 (+) Transcript_47007:70-900(+)|eukprot:6247251-Amphidinium_carterae.1